MMLLSSDSVDYFVRSWKRAPLVIAAVSLCMPIQAAYSQIVGSSKNKNGDYVYAAAGVNANPEWVIQDILARIMPPDADSIERYQFEVNLRLADTRTLYEIRKSNTFQDATRILLKESAKSDRSEAYLEPQAIGSLDKDYVYTAVAPCRIVDTRPSRGGSGIIPGNSTRDFYVYGDSSTISSQGGNPSGCPSPRGEPRAVHINATVVPQANGHLTVYPSNIGQVPVVSLVNYRAGVNIANAGIIQTQFAIGPPELRVYAHGDTHVVIDVLGYFHEVGAIDLSLLPQSVLFTTTAFGGSGVAGTVCPAGSFVTSANCDCDNVSGTRHFGVLFGCQIAGNGAVAGCFNEAGTFNPLLPAPLATVQAMCVETILPAGTTNVPGPNNVEGSTFGGVNQLSPEYDNPTEDPDFTNALQLVREQASNHTMNLKANK